LRDELEGTTRLGFIVSAEGQVEDVQVIESSGHDILDDASIKALLRRLRFRPALGENGEPVRAPMEQKVTWRL
jgi:protein TonB